MLQNVSYPLKIAKVPKDEQVKRAMRTIEMVNLGGLEKRLPSELSGGGKQRVALARALAINPDVMLLDEPISSLDPHLREEMRFEIKDLQRKYGFSIIYVTHDQAEAMALSDRILVMRLGVVQQIDSPLNIYTKPANKFVFSFIGLSNFLYVEGDGQNWRFPGADNLPKELLPPDNMRNKKKLCMASRPLEIDFASEGGIGGKVTRKAFLGDLIDLQIDIGGQNLRVQKGRRDITPNTGENCRIKFLRPFWYDVDEDK